MAKKNSDKSRAYWTLLDAEMREYTACEGVTEKVKAQNQMLWVQRMNNIRERAMEVVNNDLIHA